MNRPEPFAARKSGGLLAIEFLGRFRCFDEAGSEILIRSRKARALLAFVAASAQPVARDRLTALLWSDRGEDQARASLRQALFEIRRAVGHREPSSSGDRDLIVPGDWMLGTDLQRIAAAASDGNGERLVGLLKRSEAGLLTDLHGLDPEYDCWLRTLSAEEPSRTMALALAAAERRLLDGDLPCARTIVSEVRRIDPTNEEGVRLAMRIDHAAGDGSALHRHISQFRDSMRQEYDAAPSAATERLFAELAEDRPPPEITAKPSPAPSLKVAEQSRRRWPQLAAVLLLAMLVAGAWYWMSRPEPAQPPLMVAVLPFEAEPTDASFIAAGLWEQTRAALTRNPAIRVLGRTTTEALAAKDVPASEYRRRVGVTHMLEGSLKRNGGDVLISVSLSRTSDGVAIWHDMFRGRIDQPMALEDAVANGIEGKLRARLASGGGKRPEQIITTVEVQALYSEARALIATRDRHNSRRAEALLRDAVRRDPNYAPAWSLLGGSIHFNRRPAIADEQAMAEAMRSVRRALTLAPNLAQAHATLALLEGDNSPAAESPLRRAVALDPNYAEAWNWLGNSLNSQYRRREALAAYDRSLSLDPLYPSPVRNFASTAAELRDNAAFGRLLAQLRRAGADPILIDLARYEQFRANGDFSGGLAILAKAGRDADGRAPSRLWSSWLETLIVLQQFDIMHDITGCPDWYPPMLQSQALPPKSFDGRPVTPTEFWTSEFFSAPASRAMVNLGREADLVRLYRTGFANADAFMSATSRRGLLVEFAPTLAVALRATGAVEEARYILGTAAGALTPIVNRPGVIEPRVNLAMIRSVQGQPDQAVALMQSATKAGWRPDGRRITIDLSQEPALRPLRGHPGFEALRRQLLAHAARERTEAAAIKL